MTSRPYARVGPAALGRSGRAKLGSFLAALVILLALSAPPAFAQCSMCATSAQAAGQKGQRALNRAVGILLVPPLAMMTLLVGLAFRYRNRDG